MEIVLRPFPARDELHRQARFHWYEGTHWFEAYVRATVRIDELEAQLKERNEYRYFEGGFMMVPISETKESSWGVRFTSTDVKDEKFGSDDVDGCGTD